MDDVTPNLAEAFALDPFHYNGTNPLSEDEYSLDWSDFKKESPITYAATQFAVQKLEQAGRVRDAAVYAYEAGDYLTAAQLLVKADDAAAAMRLFARMRSPPRDDVLTVVAESVAKRSKDAVWAVLLYLEAKEESGKALQVAQQYAQRMAEGQCVPSLVELALWRIARRHVTAQPYMSTYIIDALVRLRSRMVDDVFEGLALPLLVLWGSWRDNHDLLWHHQIADSMPLAKAFVIGVKLARTLRMDCDDVAVLAKHRLIYPLRQMWNLLKPRHRTPCRMAIRLFTIRRPPRVSGAEAFVPLAKEMIASDTGQIRDGYLELPLSDEVPVGVVQFLLTQKVRTAVFSLFCVRL